MSVLIKGGRVITAADDYVADVFVDGERISLIGESLDVAADTVIDASGKYVLPGAVDPHTHLGDAVARRDHDRRLRVGPDRGRVRRHDDARRLLHPGQGTDVRARRSRCGTASATARPVIDNGFHIAVTDLRSGGTLEELGRLPDEHGVTSYKLFMAYKDSLMVDDETLFRTMQVAAETGALVMVHAENGDAIEVLMTEAIAAGNTSPRYHALTRPPETEGEATNRAIQLARVAGRAAVRRARFVPGVGRADRDRAREGLERLGRDLHAVLLHRPVVPRPPGLRGREVRLHAAAPREGEPGGAVERRAHERAAGDLDRPLRVPLQGSEGRGQRRLPPDPERRPRSREPAPADSPVRRARRADLAEPDGRAARARTRRSSSACIRARARSRSAPTPTSSSSTRRSASRSPQRRTTHAPTTTSTKARRCRARPRPCCCAAP